MSKLSIRLATVDDAQALLAIYAPYVQKTAITFEYEVPSLAEFRTRIAQTLERYPYLLAQKEGQILGYAYSHAFVGRAAYAWCAETSIYVAQGARRKGVGRALYQALENVSCKQNIQSLCACIGVPNGDDDATLTRNSIDYHAHMGYRFVGEFERCGYKFGRWYNMAWMEKHIGSYPEDVAGFIPLAELLPAYAGREELLWS